MEAKTEHTFPFMEGGGEMGELTRNKNWETTTLGAPSTWPQSLRTTLSIVLNSRFPMYVFWGPDYIGFYNDAYRVSLGKDGKHPSILGMKGKDAWPEIWDTIYPLLQNVLKGNGATWSENQLIPIYRNGTIEEAYWTFSYSPIKEEKGKINGILVTCSETTASVKTMQDLEESESDLQFAMDAAELCTWDYNPLTNKFKSNERLKEWFGLPMEFHIQLNDAIAAIQKSDQERVSKAIARALDHTSGGKYDICYTIQNKKTKQTRIVRAVGRSWFNNENIAYRFNGILQDITDDKKAQQKIQDSEKKFRNLVQDVPVGIAIINAKDFKVELVNDKALDIWNTNRNLAEGRSIFNVLTEIEAGLRPIFENVIQTQTAQTGMEYPFNLVRNGQTVTAYFNFIFSPSIDDKGNVATILCVASEVTESVIARHHVLESEAEFQNLVLQSPIAMGILRGTDLKIEMANEVLLNHFWRKKKKEVLGKNLLEVFPELNSQEYPTYLRSVIKTGKPVSVKESHAIVESNGVRKEYYVDFDYIPLKELDGSISGVMLTVTDVTNSVAARQKLENFSKELEQQVLERTELLKKANEKLEDTVRELEKSNDELESFAYISSHDLQEPLRKIQMMSSRILKMESENLSEKGMQYFDRVISAAERMRTLIEDLLAFSRTSKQQEEFEVQNLTSLLEQVIENLSEKIEMTNTQITYDELGEAKVIPFQIRQVFQNLIENSIKFAKINTPPQIDIKVKTIHGSKIKNVLLDSELSYHELSFHDNGIGFEKEHEERIFEIFKRLHGKLEYQGTGIGLAIVKKIALNHNGAVSANSSLGKGAIFRLYLPLA
ncbi:PAS domain-containing protein [Zobellia sp. 1_MG-2023]|uniref:PAS domain-containing protein n=1 Tax=Zobellia sp. 1_MG-2023 TaxID=3062626 RepID=UPI0026E21523|nr:PAS domain-containing protein [Zobellia sp. 1_MG-2023]MDO6820898.1 PAS domain-containing protein [Zobellia sp. 1_MG-2023]